MKQNSTEVNLSPKHDAADTFRQYQQRLKNFIAKRVDSKEDQEDILQNVFYQLAKADAAMSPIDELTAWLYSVTRNQIIDWRRKRKDEEMPVVTTGEDDELCFIEATETLFDEMTPSPETDYIRSLVWIELENALNELPDEQSDVFRLTELDGFSFKEIAESTAIPINTLISRKRYAVLYLREKLKQLYEDILND